MKTMIDTDKGSTPDHIKPDEKYNSVTLITNKYNLTEKWITKPSEHDLLTSL